MAIQEKFLRDYIPPTHTIEHLELCFYLDPSSTRVRAKSTVVHRGGGAHPDLVLDGKDLKLLSVYVDGKRLGPDDYTLYGETLTLSGLSERFSLEIETEIYPERNTALEGLYLSQGILCTQNEPEGFRRITYFPDRPDVLTCYRTQIIADKKNYPTLLSNGNLVGQGDLDNGKHWVLWEDPHPKPSYLFALVAGDLELMQDRYRTRSHRDIDLRLYSEKGNLEKLRFAMEALKRSMEWDEYVYGLEYDLDIYMIVAVDAFNAGAMENKGLNVFNTACLFADSKSSTDDNFLRVEGVVAHEYFHNWTGNRVTCRDWFQLTLKEGLTVFRDQEFSADVHSRAVKRIEDVLALKDRQFPEDAGPMAHPIQPQSYIQINNFYTATVYNKGAEIIRMIHTLVGEDAFQKGMDLYFERFDGKAVTTKDFLKSMEDASGKDLSQFERWYWQAGTPEVHVDYHFDAKAKSLTVDIEQYCAESADGSPKEPFHFPLRFGLVDPSGQDMSNYTGPRDILEIRKKRERFVFEKLEEEPIPSFNRDFSAPVRLKVPYSKADRARLMGSDPNAFNRWEASQELGAEILLEMVDMRVDGKELDLDTRFVEAFGKILGDEDLEPSVKALMLQLPAEDALAERQSVMRFAEIHGVREFVIRELARFFHKAFDTLYRQSEDTDPQSLSSDSVGQRRLMNVALEYLCYFDPMSGKKRALEQFTRSRNMTEVFGALYCLCNLDCPEREYALQLFYDEWNSDRLVVAKWLSVQARSKLPKTLKRVRELMKDPVFDIKNPNLIRALIGSFSQNTLHFHKEDGQGYQFLSEQVLIVDKLNPQAAARLADPFKRFPRLDVRRKACMAEVLKSILGQKTLSNNTYEIISKCLAYDTLGV